MPIFKIDPIEITTVGGLTATITGIDSSSTDSLCGSIKGPAREWNASWDDSGLCRDNDQACNLDTRTSEVADLIASAKALRTD